MKISIRNKLIFAISLLMTVVFSIAAFLFISEKRVEIAEDVYQNTLAFSRFTSGDIVENYELYLSQKGFIYFNREMRALFEENPYLGSLQILSYGADVLYDSKTESEKQYDGEKRSVNDETLIKQLKSENISLMMADGQMIFLEILEDGNVKYVDADEVEIVAPKEGSLVNYIVVPATERYSVVYHLDYAPMEKRVMNMVNRIIYLAIFAVMLGMILSFVMSGNLTRPIAKLVSGANEIAKGNFDVKVEIKTRDEMSFLGETFNNMAVDLKKSLSARLYQERVAHELKLATEIQERIIPKIIPVVEGLDISAGVLPAGEIGGDMYDFLLQENGNLLAYIGDVTGHGVPAGLVSSIANALFYGYRAETDLKRLLGQVNAVLDAKTMPNMFMTLCLLRFDAQNEKISYVNAGHEKILHYHAESGEATYEESGGIALGMTADIEKLLTVKSLELKSGDFVVLYSDGIPETWNENQEQYGLERLQKLCGTFAGLDSAAAIKKAIMADVHQFANGFEQADDITLVVIRKV